MKKLISWILILLNIHLLSKKRKIEIYKKCINKYNEKHYYLNGLCYTITNEYEDEYIETHDIYTDKVWLYMFLYFPEVYIQKPRLLEHNYWFPTDEPSKYLRIKVLTNAINTIK